MKKILAFFFALTLVFSLVACDSIDSDQTPAGGQEDTVAAGGQEDTAGGNHDAAHDFQDTYPALTEAEFLDAVANSTICVYAKGGVELAFYLDAELNILAVDCSVGSVPPPVGADYISPNMSFADGVRNIYLFICDVGMIPFDAELYVDVICEMPGESIPLIYDGITEPFSQILDLTGNYMSQTFNFTEGTID